MSKDEEAKKILRETKDKVDDYLDRANKIKQSIPYISMVKETVNGLYSGFQSKPPDMDMNLSDDCLTVFRRQRESVFNLPQLPVVNVANISTMTAVSSTAANLTIYALDAVKPENPTALQWVHNFQQNQAEIQEREEYKNKIYELLQKVKNNLAKEFIISVEEYYRIQTTNDIANAALKMRNVLEHLKGELCFQARRLPQEQKIRWETMADRLAKRGYQQDLKKEEALHLNIHDELSRIAKNIKIATKDEFKIIYSKYILHLYSVLNYIDYTLVK
jgi:hypothetical protein